MGHGSPRMRFGGIRGPGGHWREASPSQLLQGRKARPVLTERISSASAHCSAFTFGIRAGWGGGEGSPRDRVRRGDAGLGRGRGGDKVAAAVAAVAPRPGPEVQPGSRPSSSRARGADSLS
jgi:hypothetical protein